MENLGYTGSEKNFKGKQQAKFSNSKPYREPARQDLDDSFPAKKESAPAQKEENDKPQEPGDKSDSTTMQYVNAAKDSLAESLSDMAEKVKALTPKNGSFAQIGKGLNTYLSKGSDYLIAHTSAEIAKDTFAAARKVQVPLAVAVGVGTLGIFLSRKIASNQNASVKE